MILESVQLLSTAVRHYGYQGEDVYKSTHVNHPCTIWARQNRANYNWLLKHTIALAEQKFKRQGKTHKSFNLVSRLMELSDLIPDGDLSPFVNCARRADMGIDYTHIEDVHEAYQLYLNDRWDRDTIEPTWE